jgi:hypothetical protein
LLAPSRHVRTILLAGVHGFFEAQLLGMDEVPDLSDSIQFHPALGHFRLG